MSPQHRFRNYLISSVVLFVAGVVFVIFSIRGTTDNHGWVYFFWSFYKVHVARDAGIIVQRATEILLPWFLIGVTLISIGLLLLLRSRKIGFKHGKDENIPSNSQ